MAFLGSFIQYVVIMIILVAVAVVGVFLGKFLRSKKDAKALAEVSNETNE